MKPEIKEHIDLVKAYGDQLYCKARAESPVDQKSWEKSSEKVLLNIIESARSLLAASEHSQAAPNICSEHCARDATRYRTLRNMPPGIRVQVHVGDGEWEDVCSGDELDKTLDNVRAI